MIEVFIDLCTSPSASQSLRSLRIMRKVFGEKMNSLSWKSKNWKFKLGLSMVLISLFFFALLVIIPLLKIGKEEKIWFTTFSFVTAEALFYTGGFFLGKELFGKYKSYLNPKHWFKFLYRTKNKKFSDR